MLKFQESGVCDDVKNVFFPRLNVYSFLVQNAIGLEKVSYCSLSLPISLPLSLPFSLSLSLPLSLSFSLFFFFLAQVSLSFSLFLTT